MIEQNLFDTLAATRARLRPLVTPSPRHLVVSLRAAGEFERAHARLHFFDQDVQ
jgi:hypothetical protein